MTPCASPHWDTWQGNKLISFEMWRLYFTFLIRLKLSFCCFPFLQDHAVLLASLLVLQRVLAVSELCYQAEASLPAAAVHHLRSPAGDLPEAAVGPPAPARGPSQQVSGKCGIKEMRELKKCCL